MILALGSVDRGSFKQYTRPPYKLVFMNSSGSLMTLVSIGNISNSFEFKDFRTFVISFALKSHGLIVKNCKTSIPTAIFC